MRSAQPPDRGVPAAARDPAPHPLLLVDEYLPFDLSLSIVRTSITWATCRMVLPSDRRTQDPDGRGPTTRL